METGPTQQIISILKQRSSEAIKYAELDFESEDYGEVFLDHCQ
jgi:hypothetical protein